MLPSLNLLSPADKKRLRQTHVLLTVYEFGLLALIVVALGSAAMFFARTTLESKIQEVTLAEIPGTSKFAALNRDIRTINQALTRLAYITKDVDYWSPRITDIITHTPSGIRFNTLTIGEDDKVTIQGVAQTRDDLAKFRDELGTSKQVARINLPLQYFVEQERVEFTIEIFFPLKLPDSL